MYSLSSPRDQNWAYFRSTGSGFLAKGRFSKLPYLYMKLGHWPKCHKLDGSWTDLQVIYRDALTAMRCRDDVLHQVVTPFAAAVGSDFILMQDNARTHTARVVIAYMDQEGIDVMDWPARSSDTNPTAHLWNLLQRRVWHRPNPPQTVQTLTEALEWHNTEQGAIRSPIRSMPRQCRRAPKLGLGMPATEQCFQSLGLNGLDNIHDMLVDCVNTFVWGYTWFSFVLLRHAYHHLSFLSGLWVHEYMLSHVYLVT